MIGYIALYLLVGVIIMILDQSWGYTDSEMLIALGIPLWPLVIGIYVASLFFKILWHTGYNIREIGMKLSSFVINIKFTKEQE